MLKVFNSQKYKQFEQYYPSEYKINNGRILYVFIQNDPLYIHEIFYNFILNEYKDNELYFFK